MLVASPYAIFKADRNLSVQPGPRPAATAVQRPTSKTLAPIKPSSAWATLIQGDLFEPPQPF